jgi:hypothetical protein
MYDPFTALNIPHHFVEEDAGVVLAARRGKVFASRMSWATFRIFSANGSRASFCRISNFIIWAISTYAVGEFLPSQIQAFA